MGLKDMLVATVPTGLKRQATSNHFLPPVSKNALLHSNFDVSIEFQYKILSFQ